MKYNFNLENRDESIPCNIKLIWKNKEIESGFKGSNSFNNILNDLGFSLADNSSGFGEIILIKNESSPTTADLIIDCPLPGSNWWFELKCNCGDSDSDSDSGTTTPAPTTTTTTTTPAPTTTTTTTTTTPAPTTTTTTTTTTTPAPTTTTTTTTPAPTTTTTTTTTTLAPTTTTTTTPAPTTTTTTTPAPTTTTTTTTTTPAPTTTTTTTTPAPTTTTTTTTTPAPTTTTTTTTTPAPTTTTTTTTTTDPAVLCQDRLDARPIDPVDFENCTAQDSTPCPAGCCPEPGWVCCADLNFYCAASACDCPPIPCFGSCEWEWYWNSDYSGGTWEEISNTCSGGPDCDCLSPSYSPTWVDPEGESPGAVTEVVACSNTSH